MANTVPPRPVEDAALPPSDEPIVGGEAGSNQNEGRGPVSDFPQARFILADEFTDEHEGILKAVIQKRVAQKSAPGVLQAYELGRLTLDDLRSILGQHLVAYRLDLLWPGWGLPVEVRLEPEATYCLVPPQYTSLGSMRGETIAWARNQRLGHSQFATFSEDIPEGISSEALRTLLGLEGDPTFAGQLDVVRARLNKALFAAARPGVPICHNVCTDGVWHRPPQFLAGNHAVPGWTSRGTREVIINTLSLAASNLLESASEGVTIERCSD